MLIEEDIGLWKQGFFGGDEEEIQEGIDKLEAERQALIEAALIKRLEAAEYDRISKLPPEEQAAALEWLVSGNFGREAIEKKREKDAFDKRKKAYGYIDVDEEIHKIDRTIREIDGSFNAMKRAEEKKALLVEKTFLEKWFLEKFGHVRVPRTPTPPPDTAVSGKLKKKKQKTEAQIKAEQEAMAQLLAAQAALREEEQADQHEEFKKRAAARKAALKKDDPEWKKEYLRKARLHGYATKIQTMFRRYDSHRRVAIRIEEIRMYPFKLAASIEIQAATRRFIIRCRLPTIRHDKIIYDKRRRRMLMKRDARLKREEEERIEEVERLRQMRVAFNAQMAVKAAAAAEVRERRHARMAEKEQALKDEVEDRTRLRYGEGHLVRKETATRLRRHATAAREAVHEYSMAWPPPQQHGLPPSPMASCFDSGSRPVKEEEASIVARGSMEHCKEKWVDWKMASQREEEEAHSSDDVIARRLTEGRPTAEPFADKRTKAMLKDLRHKQRTMGSKRRHSVDDGRRMGHTAPPGPSHHPQRRPPPTGAPSQTGAQTTRPTPGVSPKKRVLRRRSVEEVTHEWATSHVPKTVKTARLAVDSSGRLALEMQLHQRERAVRAAVAAAQAGVAGTARLHPSPPPGSRGGVRRRYHA